MKKYKNISEKDLKILDSIKQGYGFNDKYNMFMLTNDEGIQKIICLKCNQLLESDKIYHGCEDINKTYLYNIDSVANFKKANISEEENTKVKISKKNKNSYKITIFGVYYTIKDEEINIVHHTEEKFLFNKGEGMFSYSNNQDIYITIDMLLYIINKIHFIPLSLIRYLEELLYSEEEVFHELNLKTFNDIYKTSITKTISPINDFPAIYTHILNFEDKIYNLNEYLDKYSFSIEHLKFLNYILTKNYDNNYIQIKNERQYNQLLSIYKYLIEVDLLSYYLKQINNDIIINQIETLMDLYNYEVINYKSIIDQILKVAKKTNMIIDISKKGIYRPYILNNSENFINILENSTNDNQNIYDKYKIDNLKKIIEGIDDLDFSNSNRAKALFAYNPILSFLNLKNESNKIKGLEVLEKKYKQKDRKSYDKDFKIFKNMTILSYKQGLYDYLKNNDIINSYDFHLSYTVISSYISILNYIYRNDDGIKRLSTNHLLAQMIHIYTLLFDLDLIDKTFFEFTSYFIESYTQLPTMSFLYNVLILYDEKDSKRKINSHFALIITALEGIHNSLKENEKIDNNDYVELINCTVKDKVKFLFNNDLGDINLLINRLTFLFNISKYYEEFFKVIILTNDNLKDSSFNIYRTVINILYDIGVDYISLSFKANKKIYYDITTKKLYFIDDYGFKHMY